MELEADSEDSTSLEAAPEDIASLKHLAQVCERHLQKGLRDEEAQEDVVKAGHGYWASRQFAEFNLWCAKVGVNGEGLRSIDVRLKDMPTICELLRLLLQSLERDLSEIHQIPGVPSRINSANIDPDDAKSDASSLSFDSLSSLERPSAERVTGDIAPRNLALQRHIEDTIDRLHGHALRIERAGAKHRRERVEIYRQKEGPRWTYEGFTKLAIQTAKAQFPSAADAFRQRMAESFARRRIRFEYLKQHQKKRAVNTDAQEQDLPSPETLLEPKGGDEPVTLIKQPEIGRGANVPVRNRIQDQQTIYSATAITKLDPRPDPGRQKQAESVASVALRHPGFPPPPKISGGSFQCPYCRLSFRSREAEKDRWSQHVMQDFEPYFCTFEECKAPFDLPNSFDGLLGHLQDHLPVQYHVDMPNGEHEEFDEMEFEEHITKHGGISEEMLTTMKEASRRKGAFLFEICPFCGGYPDILEKQFPDPDTPEAQKGLRKHIKQHMQDIALFLPPYREDVLDEDDDLKSSAISRRRSVNQIDLGEPDDYKIICDRQDCDCKDKGKHAAENVLAVEDIAETERPQAEEDVTDFWPEIFGNSTLYNRSGVSGDYYLSDERLRPFIARLEPAFSPNRPTQSLDPGDYTIGWICAKTTESVAAHAFLDEHYDHPKQLRIAYNSYTLGRVGNHNVVITVIPIGTYGTAAATSFERDMLHNFPNIRIVLMVGIGGGAPSPKHDIRLGDVVVGTPHDGNGGVLRYDFDKMTNDLSFRIMKLPPTVLRAAVDLLRAQYEVEGHGIEEAINSVLEKNPRLRKKYQRPDPRSDRLYQADVTHPLNDQASCSVTCGDDLSKLISRPARTEDEGSPTIHHGWIASAKEVMEDAIVRDRIAAEYDVLCFEVGAAEFTSQYNGLVILGICDYSDSHKNNEWQGYAAMAAAAYAKELLYRIAPDRVEAENRIDIFHADIQEENSKVIHVQHNQESKAILEWITPIDYGLQQSDYFGRRQAGTGQWLLDSKEYQRWIGTSKLTMFCPGMFGAGKTILTSIVVNDLITRNQNNQNIGVAYLYCDIRRQGEQKAKDLLASLLKQLSQGQSSLPGSVRALHNMHQERGKRTSIESISKTLESVARMYSRIFIVVDALDECQATGGCRARLLSELFDLQTKCRANIFATSRFIPEVTEKFEGSMFLEIRASPLDIMRCLDDQMSRLPSFFRHDADLRKEIKRRTVHDADGVFLFAQLSLASLIGRTTASAIRKALENLTESYDSAYHYEVERIKGQQSDQSELALQALSWITLAQRSLTTSELQCALAVEVGQSGLNKDNLPDIENILSVCVGLVTIEKVSNIVRFAHHTTLEYFQRTWRRWFPNAQVKIAEVCITYLSFDIFDTGYCESDPEFEARLRTNVLYDYAARHWGDHARLEPVRETLILNLLNSRNKVSAASQAMMISGRQAGCSQHLPTQVAGVHIAAYFGLVELVAYFLKHWGNIDLHDSYGQTPLLWAAWRGHEAVVKLLLEKGADLESKDYNGRTPLFRAVSSEHEAVVKLLLKEGADLESKDSHGRTPLLEAISCEYEAVVKLFLEKGADLESKDINGWTPLFQAVRQGYMEIVELLLKQGANLESKDNNGQTPLSWAAGKGHEGVVKLLLENGAYLESGDNNSQTPLSWAAKNGYEKVVELLLEKGANLNSLDDQFQTPLSLAAELGQEAVVKILLEKGADFENMDLNNQTPLSLAIENGREEVVELLLDYGADPKSVYIPSTTLLSEATQKRLSALGCGP